MTKRTPGKGSLIERAAKIYDFGAALHGKGLPPLNVDESAIPVPPTAPVAPVGSVAPPQVVASAAPVPAVGPDAAPASVVAPPKPRARDWTGPMQPLDRKAMEAAGYLVPNGPVSGIGEEFRIIKRELLASIRGTKQQEAWPNGNVILITSAHSGDGKTFCAINLAMSLAAESDLEILLVDGDIARPTLCASLGITGERGFMDALVDPSLPVDTCVIPTDVPTLFVLPSGRTTNNDAEHLASVRMEKLIDALVAGRPNRVVIFDSPPLLAATPAAVIATHVGQTVMVVRADRTTEAALRDCANLLRGCSQIRLLLNGVKFSASGRRFGTYYGKGG